MEDEIELNKRRKNTLAKLDKAKFSWFHVRVLVVNGVGFFTVKKRKKAKLSISFFNLFSIFFEDAYDIFVMYVLFVYAIQNIK